MSNLSAMPDVSPDLCKPKLADCVAAQIPEMLTIEQTRARIPGLSYDYLRKLCLTHQIVHVRAGSKYLINFGRLVEYLNGQQ